jgi:hypothetical protein
VVFTGSLAGPSLIWGLPRVMPHPLRLSSVQRLQVVLEGPLGHAPALISRHLIGRAEVDALVDAHVNHLLGRLPQSAIRARLLHGLWVEAREREGQVVRREEELQDLGHSARKIVGARSILRIVRGVNQGLPARIPDSPGVPIRVPLLNGGDGAPEDL